MKKPTVQGHVRHAESYLKAFPDKRVAQHSRADVTRNGVTERIPGPLDTMLQMLSLTLFERTPVNQLLGNSSKTT